MWLMPHPLYLLLVIPVISGHFHFRTIWVKDGMVSFKSKPTFLYFIYKVISIEIVIEFRKRTVRCKFKVKVLPM